MKYFLNNLFTTCQVISNGMQTIKSTSRTPDAFFPGVKIVAGVFILMSILSVGCYWQFFAPDQLGPESSVVQFLYAVDAQNVSATDFGLFLFSTMYLLIEFGLLFALMVCADVGYAWVMFKRLATYKKSEACTGPQAVWVKTLVFWMSLGGGALAWVSSSVGLTALIVSDRSFNWLTWGTPSKIVGLTIVLICYACAYSIATCDKCCLMPFIHYYLSVALVLTNGATFVGVYVWSFGVALCVVTNIITVAAVIYNYSAIHAKASRHAHAISKCWVFHKFTQSPVDSAEALLRAYIARLFKFLVISKWCVWWCGSAADPMIFIHVQHHASWSILVLLLAAIAWVHSAYSFLGTSLRVEYSSVKPKIFIPVEPVILWRLCMHDWCALFKISYLKHYRKLNMHGTVRISKNGRFSRPGLGLRLRCVIYTLLHPTVGLTKQWVRLMVLKKVISCGTFDEVFWTFTWKGVLIQSLKAGTFASAVLSGAGITLTSLAVYETNVWAPNRISDAAERLAAVPGMPEAIKNDEHMARDFATLKKSLFNLRTNRTSTNMLGAIARGKVLGGLIDMDSDYDKGRNAVFNISEKADKAGLPLPDWTNDSNILLAAAQEARSFGRT